MEEEQSDNKNDVDYNPDEIQKYWIEKHRSNQFVNTVKQAINKIENMNTSRIEPISVISSMITQSRNIVSTRSKTTAVKTESQPAIRYNLRSR
jgi:macrodomain Ter protein organizer (MatP/YcbG family)